MSYVQTNENQRMIDPHEDKKLRSFIMNQISQVNDNDENFEEVQLDENNNSQRNEKDY